MTLMLPHQSPHPPPTHRGAGAGDAEELPRTAQQQGDVLASCLEVSRGAGEELRSAADWVGVGGNGILVDCSCQYDGVVQCGAGRHSAVDDQSQDNQTADTDGGKVSTYFNAH